ncbi:MAG TPA: hypothetical protein DDX13_06465 [Marinobacter adhaerens]|jgi:hypothetical protein|uniref:Uncharacterized protein n=1 Tax=Marinobacter adhaerens TaxID=1033846 RepID=A0A349GIT2_9GAMM|nr:hypothetical protein [Marinobacter adhaerens]MEC7727713.1 hypothetical protein [Pseudomonadota bacterium]MTI77059.1 hypothetical protein [Marinobacter sp.]HAP51653.1 hypothetical protein [Marinobacter adhaerens]HAS76945.1 hypothetical protein [Marinobacter adhaerens]|tara:strand:- start:1232 stop:2356 length:1125 start_codon:yes stop_codon:yes gene_type:complete
MRKLLLILGISVIVALLSTVTSRPMLIEERLIQIQAENTLREFPRIEKEPLEVQAALLDMADDELLLLKARAAYLRYPAMTREVFPLYGPEPEFREILRLYGENILPPIHYFLSKPVGSIELMNDLASKYQAALEFFTGGEETDNSTGGQQNTSRKEKLTPEERGWYAVRFIQEEGHDFLGQFVFNEQGDVIWVRTERVLENINQFFASGIRNLEIQHRTGDDVTASDIGWASVDVLVFASALKVLRVGRAVAVSSRGAARGTRSAALAARLTTSGRMLMTTARYAKWPAVIGVGYLVVTHPGIINDVLAEVAEVMGYPVKLVQFLGWMLILLPVLYIGSWVFRLIVRPALGLLGTLIIGLSHIGRKKSLNTLD